METMHISVTMTGDTVTAFIRRKHWERGRARAVGTTMVRHIVLPGGPTTPAALLGALSAAYDASWEDSWVLTRVAGPAPLEGPQGGLAHVDTDV